MFQFMPNLWDIFVEYVFGGFWLSVVGLSVVMTIMMMLGGVSAFSTMIFCLAFLLVMAMGYGYPIITVPLWTFIFAWSAFQVYKLMSSSSQ